MIENSENNDYKQIRAIYLLFTLGAAACFISIGLVFTLGTLAMLVGIVMAYRLRRREINDIYRTHIKWQIRGFWIANLLVFPVAMIVHFALAYYLTDIGVLLEKASGGAYGINIAQLEAELVMFQKENMVALAIAKWAGFGPALLWWAYHNMRGYRRLETNRPA